MQWVAQLLETAGLGRDRLQLRWISSAEAHLFAEYVTELTELIAGLGPLPRDQANLRMAALERTLNTSKIRWLIGMERQLTEKENVFHERLESTNYQTLLQRVTEEEYQKALIFGSLQEGPKTVAEMATQTGLPVYTLSVRLNDLERIGQASLAGHEGTNYLFKIAEV